MRRQRDILFNQYPAGPQDGKSDESDSSSDGDELVRAQFPSRQGSETEQGDEDGQPVADSDPGEQRAGTKNCPDGGGISPLHETLHVPVLPVPTQRRRGNKNQHERREEDAEGGDDRTPKPRDEIAHERRGDNNRPGAEHSDRDRNQEGALVQPSRLL